MHLRLALGETTDTHRPPPRIGLICLSTAPLSASFLPQERAIVEKLIYENAQESVPPPVLAILDQSVRLANEVLECFDTFDTKVAAAPDTLHCPNCSLPPL